MRKIALLVLAGLTIASTEAGAQTVVRGSTPTSQRQGLPQVLRGTVPHEEPAPAAATPRVYAVGGENLWLIDETGGLTGCTLRGSGYVGQNVIYCTNGTVRR